jgi:hypothetical protein
MEKHTKRQHIKKDLPYQSFGRYREMPETFNWLNFEGENNLSRSLNQHLPVYCGSCWAHAAASVIADRIKIIRLQYLRSGDEFDEDGFYPDVSLSIQFILNCGAEIAGSCKGGEMYLFVILLSSSSLLLLLLLSLQLVYQFTQQDIHTYKHTLTYIHFVHCRFCNWCIPIH